MRDGHELIPRLDKKMTRLGAATIDGARLRVIVRAAHGFGRSAYSRKVADFAGIWETLRAGAFFREGFKPLWRNW
jgi:hypothetical protein